MSSVLPPELAELSRAVFEAVPDHLYLVDNELRCVWTNRDDLALGAEPDTAADRSLAAWVSAEVFERARACVNTVRRSGEPERFRAPSAFGDETAWHQIEIRPLAGRSDRLLVVARDVTRERRLEGELQNSRSWEHELVSQYPGIVVLLELDGTIVLVNETAARSLGDTPAQLAGQGIFEVMPPEVVENRRWWFETVIESGQPLSGIERDGDRFHNTTVFLVRQGGGKPPRVGIVSRDATDEQRAQEVLRERERRQGRSEKMEALGTLAAGIAHDFNNLLTPIVMNARLAARSDALTRADQLAAIEEAAMRAASLVRQILAYSQHGGDQEPHRLELRTLVSEVAELARSVVSRKVTVQTQLADRVAWVNGVAERLQQALVNLVINANQAMGSAGGVLTIELGIVDGAGGEPGTATIVVRDTGPGIEPEQLPRVFEPFFSTKGPHEGTGLGLYVVHRVATDHGGDISVDSKPGHGATFSLTLPLAAREADAEPTASEQPVAPPRLRLLLVDDDENVGRACESWLVAEGQHVRRASTVDRAMDVFAAAPETFDAAVLDYQLGSRNGVELARELWTRRPTLPVVLYSGYLTNAVKEAVAGRPVAFLPKPFEPDALLDTVARLVAKRSS